MGAAYWVIAALLTMWAVESIVFAWSYHAFIKKASDQGSTSARPTR